MTARNKKQEVIQDLIFIENKEKTMAFRKGKSGNPGGRPKKKPEDYDLEMACKDMTPQAFETLACIMEKGEIERNRMIAAQMIIERAHGKPRQITEFNGSINNGTVMSDIERAARISALLATAKARMDAVKKAEKQLKG
jgi:hypothetical protein